MNGEPKQLLKFEGKTLLRRAAEIAVQANFYSTVIVLGANINSLQKEVEDLPLEIAENEIWDNGISSSIKAGLNAVSRQNLDAAVIMLCDQPLVTTKTLHKIRDVFLHTGTPIAACQYQNTAGVPALFAREIFTELLNLQEDEGAKKIIQKYADKTTLISAPEAAFDVDTLQDYEKLKSKSAL